MYMLVLLFVSQCENFIKESVGKNIFVNPVMWDNDNYTNYGLRSYVSPPQNLAFTSFENDIYDKVRNIEFMNSRNDFQDKLKEDINKIRSSKKLLVSAGKSTNLYEMSVTDYNRLLGNNITSNYRKCENGVKHIIDKETRKIAQSLDLSKKMECYASSPVFITTEDHKPNFQNNTKCRLINPAKKELGLVSKKKHLEKLIANIAKDHHNQPMMKHYS